MKHINTSNEAKSNCSPMYGQYSYPGEEDEEIESKGGLKLTSTAKYPRVMEPEVDIFNKPAKILVTGASNSGKSYLVSNFIQRWHERFERIVVIGNDLENVLGMNVSLDDFYNPLNESSLVILEDVFSIRV